MSDETILTVEQIALARKQIDHWRPFLNADIKSLLRDVDTICDSHESLRAERDTLRAKVQGLQSRTILAEQRNTLERLGRSSINEVTEDALRTTLAETDIRAEQAEARVTALTQALAQAQESNAKLTEQIAQMRILQRMRPAAHGLPVPKEQR